ncbi:MAG: hypothetical protein P8Y36_14065, partial [Alphaproteobacteria bacterium]
MNRASLPSGSSTAPTGDSAATDSASASASSSEPLSKDDIAKLKNGTDKEKLEILAKLAKKLGDGKEVPVEAVKKFLEENGIKNTMLDKVVKSQKALGSLMKMTDTLSGNGSTTEKVAAVLDFLQTAGGSFSGKIGEFLEGPLKGVSGAKEIIDGINTLSDPKASVFDKVHAALNIAGGLKNAGALDALHGKVAETLNTYLGGTKNAQEIVKDVSTLIDSKASRMDKA